MNCATHCLDEAALRRAETLNTHCQCLSVDRTQLAAELERVSPGFHAEVLRRAPHLFADSVVFVAAAHLDHMAALVAAVERVVALPAWQAHVLTWAPEVARHDPGTPGVFFGFDFHLGGALPQLIEINSNAGGGLLNALLSSACRACCVEVAAAFPAVASGSASPQAQFVAMFAREWALWCAAKRGCRATKDDSPSPLPRAIAIVDDTPEAQFLAPEFTLFARLFRAHGITTLICDPAQLRLQDGALWHGAQRIDLVYNRLTDFAFAAPTHAVLREAWLTDAALITPHPRAHALYADKRNLAVLGDAGLLTRWGVDAPTQALLRSAVPATERVCAAQAESLWQRRRNLFFKPAGGFASRAAYRGDKLTRRVFAEILAGDYIAQALVQPSQRTVSVEGSAQRLKLDLRNYSYAGVVQLVAARLYQGQTTNLRTPGGGFAPVQRVPGAHRS